MNIRDIDLNLLVVFDAVLDQGSVVAAARQLGVSQPTVSNALRRLRVTLDDTLFVRGQGGMQPTPLAQELAPSIRGALSTLERSLRTGTDFDPKKSRRTFVIAMSDVAEITLLPRVVDVCRTRAPHIDFNCVQLSQHDTAQRLEVGGIDLAIGFMPDMREALYQQKVFATRYVCIIRPDHPLWQKDRPISLGDFQIASATADVSGHSVVANALIASDFADRIAVRVPHMLALPFIVAASDLLAIVPESLVDRLGIRDDFTIEPVPIALPKIEVRLFWHERVLRDPANMWLRALLREALSPVDHGGAVGPMSYNFLQRPSERSAAVE